MLSDKRIVVGVSGGIAAYKTPELVRRLRERGAQVRVVSSEGAQAFVTPLTFQAVSGQPVHTDLFDPAQESAFGHIDLARWADAIVVAPASAHTLAKLAHGLADDLLSTLCLASEAPLLVAPAMNRVMWAAPATQANCVQLRERGVHFCGPASGAQACGESGAGRMAEAAELLDALEALFMPAVLDGRRVLITAGPTREDLDPVRFISNRSSGRMGYAMAAAAHAAGAAVTLVRGPVHLAPLPGVESVQVYSAQDMLEAVLARIEACEIFIATAAVADYRPAQRAVHKVKKNAAELVLKLERTPDILSQVSALPHKPFTVGFAAETENLEQYARGKLEKKKLDMIAANQVGISGQGFDSETNALHVLWQKGEEILPLASKTELGRQLVALIARVYADTKA